MSGVTEVGENRERPISRDHCQLKGSGNKGDQAGLTARDPGQDLSLAELSTAAGGPRDVQASRVRTYWHVHYSSGAQRATMIVGNE